MKIFARLTLIITVFVIAIGTVGCGATVKGKFIPANPDADLRPRRDSEPDWAIGWDYRPYNDIGDIEVNVCLGPEGKESLSYQEAYDLAKEKMLDIAWDKGCDAIIRVDSKTWTTASFTNYDAVNNVTITHPSMSFIKYTGKAVAWR